MPYWKNVKVIPTHQDVFGVRGKTEKEVISGLREFSSAAILHICTKLMLFLNSPNALNPEKQVELVGQLLDLETRKRLAEFIKEQSTPDIVFFHHMPVLMLIKLNLEHNDVSGLEINDDATRTKFVSILVSVCDMWVTNEPLQKLGNRRMTKQFKEGFRIYQAKQFLLEGNEPVINMVARGRYLIDDLKKIPALKLEELFERGTGIKVDMYLDILFMIMTQWTIGSETKTLNEIAIRNIDRFFEQTTLKRNDIDKFLQVVGFNYADFKTLNGDMTKRVGMDGDTSINNLVLFMSKPVLRYNDNFICLSPNFLALQLTQGVYNVVREELKNENDPDLLAKEWGQAYERYIVARLTSAFGKLFTPNVLDNSGKEALDGIVDLGEAALLIEIKYPHWSYRARMSGKRDDMHGFMEKIAAFPKTDKRGRPKGNVKKAKGLGQIKHFVLKLNEGKINPPFALDKKALIPVLILGEEFPCDPINRELLEGYAASAQCTIADERALPFILLTSEDVELIEALVEAGKLEDVKKYLIGYSIDFHPKRRKPSYTERASSFKNKIYNLNLKVPNSKFMKKQLDTHTKPLKRHFKAAAKSKKS